MKISHAYFLKYCDFRKLYNIFAYYFILFYFIFIGKKVSFISKFVLFNFHGDKRPHIYAKYVLLINHCTTNRVWRNYSLGNLHSKLLLPFPKFYIFCEIMRRI